MAEAGVLDAYCAWADGSGLPDAEAEAGDALATLLRRGPAARRELVEILRLEVALHRVLVLPPPTLPWWRRPLGPGGWTAGVLLLVAIIGSVMLARTLKQEASADDVDPEVLKAEIARDPELAGVEPQLD